MASPSNPSPPLRVVLLDRDGVVLVNRPVNIKRPVDLELLPCASRAIARLTAAGVRVAICTNQPEVSRGVMSPEQLDRVHSELKQRLAVDGGKVDFILCCTTTHKNPWLKPGAGMLQQALERYGAVAAQTPFVGDQVDDLKAAFHAGCKRFLVKTGLGRKTLQRGLPDYVSPVTIVDNLAAAVDVILAERPKD